MKRMIAGRRAAGITHTEMRPHMLAVHGPMGVADAGLTARHLARYRQNHVTDSLYGVDAMPGSPMAGLRRMRP